MLNFFLVMIIINNMKKKIKIGGLFVYQKALKKIGKKNIHHCSAFCHALQAGAPLCDDCLPLDGILICF